jgi:hypothetical protein
MEEMKTRVSTELKDIGINDIYQLQSTPAVEIKEYLKPGSFPHRFDRSGFPV